MGTREVLLVGASGAVGGELLTRLGGCAEVNSISVLARRPDAVPSRAGKATVRSVICPDFSKLNSSFFEAGKIPDACFIALGTTLRQVGGSREAFRQVDHEHVVRIARLARQAGVRFMAVVSAVGADSGSSIFYNKVKGETEDILRQLGFPLLVIARPSLILANRTENRRGEDLAKRIVPFLFPWIQNLLPAMARYRPVSPAAIAEAMVGVWMSSTSSPLVILEGRDFFPK